MKQIYKLELTAAGIQEMNDMFRRNGWTDDQIEFGAAQSAFWDTYCAPNLELSSDGTFEFKHGGFSNGGQNFDEIDADLKFWQIEYLLEVVEEEVDD